jgi:hypothetical protein
MNKQREEEMAKARAKRSRRQQRRQGCKKAAQRWPEDIPHQVKEVAVAAIETVGGLVKSAVEVVQGVINKA